jgi:hypothetical protein
MTDTSKSGRWNRGAWLFRDETLERLKIILDEAVRIPGTGIRFGLDGIIGLVPGLGDVVAGLLSLVIPLAAWVRGLPYITLIRMTLNLGIGVLIGTIPLFGTFSISPGRPTGEITGCCGSIWASHDAIHGETGLSWRFSQQHWLPCSHCPSCL